MVNKGKPQEWLEKKYSNSATEIKVDFGDEFEKGELKVENYSALKIIQLKGTKGISKLTIDSCPNVEEIDVYDNEITEIVGLETLSKLRKLNCGGNAMMKIDVSKNTNLEVLLVHDKNNGMQVVGIENLPRLVKYSGGQTSAKGISIDLTKISQEGWKEAAKKLDIDTGGKDIREIKDLVEKRGERDRENEKKLNDTTNGLPGLLSTKGDVDDGKLKEINDKLKEINQVHDVNTYPDNKEILDNGKFSPEKVKKLAEKGKDYDKLVKDNDPDLVENGKISQDKIKGLKDANKDAADAITRLGVKDLKVNPTLDEILGNGTKLSDIPTKTNSKDLKGLVEGYNTLANALNKVGIDPKGQDVEKQLEKLKNDSQELEITERLAKAEVGKETWEHLEEQKTQILIEVNRK